MKIIVLPIVRKNMETQEDWEMMQMDNDNKNDKKELKNVKIITYNVNGAGRNKKINSFIEKNKEVDILCIQECNSSILKQLKENYPEEQYMYFCNNVRAKSYVVLIVRKALVQNEEHISYKDGFYIDGYEKRNYVNKFVEIVCEIQGQKVRILGIHNSFGSELLSSQVTMLYKLNRYIDELCKNHEILIILGDFNIDWKQYEKEESVCTLFKEFQRKMDTPFVEFLKDESDNTLYTRKTKCHSSYIDYIFTRNIVMDKASITIQTDVKDSDHYPVVLSL